MTQKILFVGAGAVGGYVGANMARAGLDVTLVDPWVEHVSRMREPGLSLQGLTEPECFQIRMNAFTPEEFRAVNGSTKYDVAVVSTKSYDTAWAAQFIEPHLTDDGFVVSLQNAINEPTIAGVVGESRTVGCIASTITVGLYTPGLVQRNVPKRGDAYTVFRCGEFNGTVTPRVQTFVDSLKSVDSAAVTSNLIGERWTKMVINTSRNGLLASSGMETAAMELERNARRLCIRLAAETIQVAQAQHVALEAIGGFAPRVWLDAATGRVDARDSIESEMVNTAATRVSGTQLSMGQDIEKGRRTEIDDLNGLVVEKGKALGIATPANEGIWRAVRRVESGEVSPALENIEHLFRLD